MNTNEITSADVAAWMREQLAKVHELQPYGHVTVTVSQYKGYDAVPKFSIYCADEIKSDHHTTISACLDEIASFTPQKHARELREKAEELIAKAEKIEAKAATL